jgi:hypothetical protein
VVGSEINNNNYYYVSETFKWLETPGEITGKIRSVFVSGSQLSLSSNLTDKRVMVISGNVHTGRYSLALHIAGKLAEISDFRIVTIKCLVDTSILSILMDKNIPSNSIFLIRNGFDNPGVFVRDLLETSSDIIKILKQNNSYLIITNSKPDLQFPSDIYTVSGTGLTLPDLYGILQSHVNFYRNDLDSKVASLHKDKALANKLVEILGSAHYIDDYIKTLFGVQTENKIEDTLIKRAHKISRPDLQLSKWFQDIKNDIELYFAFTVALFPDLRHKELFIRFSSDVDFLRPTRSHLSHVADHEWNYYLEKTACRLSNWDAVEFEDSRFYTYIVAELRNNFFFHYWKLRNEYINEIKKHEARDEIEIRVSYARALGELGKADVEELKSILSILAQDNSLSIRASTGYCLKQLYSDPSTEKHIKGLLLEWSNSENEALRWTALATGERLYSEFPETVLGIINRLAASDWQNPRAVTHALRKISRIDPEKVSNLLCQWIDETEVQKNNILRKAALSTSYKILEDLKPGDITRRKSILPLAEKLLNHSDKSCQTTLEVIRRWILQDPSGDWTDVSNVLANIIASERMAIVETVINDLEKYWLSTSSAIAQNIARQLIDYHEGDGMNTSVQPKKTCGILLVDIKNGNGRAFQYARELEKKLTWATISIAPMGISGFEAFDISSWVLRNIKPARLVGHVLEKLHHTQYGFVLILTLDNVIDLADWILTPWMDKLIVCGFGAKLTLPLGTNSLPTLSPEQIDAYLQAFVTHQKTN